MPEKTVHQFEHTQSLILKECNRSMIHTHHSGTRYCNTCERVQNYDNIGCEVCGRPLWVSNQDEVENS